MPLEGFDTRTLAYMLDSLALISGRAASLLLAAFLCYILLVHWVPSVSDMARRRGEPRQTSRVWPRQTRRTSRDVAPRSKRADESLVSRIESRTERRVTLECDAFAAQGKFDEQTASPLFSILPAELRDMIWAFTTAPYEDSNAKYDATEYYCRPGHTARLKTDTNLLLACRRIWLEANAMPMLQAEHSYYRHRPAPDCREPGWMENLTAHNRQNFGHLHLFAQMYAIEGLDGAEGRLRHFFMHGMPVPGDFQPRMLHVTIRHTDWWNWEEEAPLRLKDGWVIGLLNNPDLRSTETLKLELETLDYKVDQLEPIVQRLQQLVSQEYETHMIDGKPRKTKFVLTGEPTTYEWKGPANINKEQFDPYDGKTSLKYHVTTMTWKLRFSEIPGAFVPHLRRAVRVAHSQRDPLSSTARGYPTSTVQQPQRGPRAFRGRRSKRIANARAIADMAFFKDGYEEVQRGTKYIASRIEIERAERFRGTMKDMMRDTEIEKWKRKWQAEKSLLKFVE